MSASARKITLIVDGIQIGTGKLWDGIVIDTAIIWSTDPALCASVNSHIEAAIRRGQDGIVYVNDDGERVAVSWEIEQ